MATSKKLDINYNELDQLPYTTKYTVFGFIRNTEHLLSNKTTLFQNIPELIYYVCLSYYCLEPFNKFDPTLFKLSGSWKNIVTRIGDNSWKNAIYGTQWIQSNISQIIIWKFEVIKVSSRLNYMIIGVVSNNHHLSVSKDFDADGSYVFGSNGYISVNGKDKDEYGVYFDDGHKFEFILDLKSKTIKVNMLINDKPMLKSPAILIDNIKTSDSIQYRLAITMYRPLDALKLLDIRVQH